MASPEPTPYFDDGTVVLYHGDCREVLPLLARDSVDLLVTDPPYGVGFRSGRRVNALPGSLVTTTPLTS
jgi:site-specific DNA-methyltransferase (adenine-specific)